MTAAPDAPEEVAPTKRRLVAMPLSDLLAAERNPQGHDIPKLSKMIAHFGFVNVPILDERTGRLVAGHGRAETLRKQKAAKPAAPPEGIDLRESDGEWLVPTLRGWSSSSDEDAEAYLLGDNHSNELGGQDERLLAEMLADLADVGLLEYSAYDPEDLDELESALLGEGDGEGNEKAAANTGILAERFGIPPFTVLDTRAGLWRTRKKAWLSIGIRSEEGRGDGGLVYGGVQKQDPQFYAKKRAVEAKLGRELTTQEFLADHYVAESADGAKQQAKAGKSGGIVFNAMNRRDPDYYRKKEAVEQRLGRKLGHEEFLQEHYDGMKGSALAGGTSIFDPVLCELAYRWYCPQGGVVIDPFAGGSVRGVVAAAVGRQYFGGELRDEQVEANRAQWRQISAAGYLPEDAPEPTWQQGDSTTLRANFPADVLPPSADLLFTCPPYADLEVYSDDPADLSNKPYPQFLEGYRACLGEGVALLAPDSFAVLVVGEVRSKKGHGAYYGFVQDTIAAMIDLGLDYYSEHVLINMVGSAAMAANKQFTASRKAVRVHQNVLVFVKGDAKRAAARNELDTAVDLPDPETLAAAADDEAERGAGDDDE